jgi:alpha-L-fucosidase
VNFGKGGDAAKQAEYARICERMVSELWGNYGGLFYVWFDGGALPPDKGGPDLVPILKKLQPHAVCFQGPPGTPAGPAMRAA